jgi:hypothetical protein
MRRILYRERGIAAMEMTVVAGLSIIVLAMIVLAGRFTWHAIVMTKSVANASRIVATLPRTTIAGEMDTLLSFTAATIKDTTRSAGLDLQPRNDGFSVMCGSSTCTDRSFDAVSVSAQLSFRDTIFGSAYQQIGLRAVTIVPSYTQNYAQPYPDAPTNMQ